MRYQSCSILAFLVLMSIVIQVSANNYQFKNDTLNSNNHRRVKRKVIFTKNSKIFFRVNGKLNVVPYVQVFAYGYAVRVNWDLPETLHRRHKFFKRDLHAELEKIQFNRNENYQTYACLFSYLCNHINKINKSTNIKGKCGILCSIGKIISQSSGIEADFFKSIANKCNYYIQTCNSKNLPEVDNKSFYFM